MHPAFKRVLLIALGLLMIGLAVIVRLTSPAVELGGQRFGVEVADTPAEHQYGLSGRKSLGASHSMLFVFSQPTMTCFWMKDMRFNIDILWFDADHKLIHQERDLSPQTYPRQYCPERLTKYVLEVKAGTAEKLGLQDGAELRLRNL